MCLKLPQRSHHWIFSNMLRPARVKRTRYPRNASASRDMPLFSMDEDFEYGATTQVGARVIRRVQFDKHVVTYGFLEIDEDMMRDEDPEIKRYLEPLEDRWVDETNEDHEADKESSDTEGQPKQSAKTRWPERDGRRFTPVDWLPGSTYVEWRFPPGYFAIPLPEDDWTDVEDSETEDEGAEETRPDGTNNNLNTTHGKKAAARSKTTMVVGFEGPETLVELPAEHLKKAVTCWTKTKLGDAPGIQVTGQPVWRDTVIISPTAPAHQLGISAEYVSDATIQGFAVHNSDSSRNEENVNLSLGATMLKNILAWAKTWWGTGETALVPSTRMVTSERASEPAMSRLAMHRCQFDS